MFPLLPQGLDDLADKVVPGFQRHGIFRKDDGGHTLRENPGLAARRPRTGFSSLPGL